jgi:hypothetical protein
MRNFMTCHRDWIRTRRRKARSGVWQLDAVATYARADRSRAIQDPRPDRKVASALAIHEPRIIVPLWLVIERLTALRQSFANKKQDTVGDMR